MKSIGDSRLKMNDWVTEGFEDMELSTQVLIKEALNRGISVEVLDWGDNFIRLKKEDKVEYIKQATRTSADKYIAALIMENKHVTKQVLEASHISVPKGKLFQGAELALAHFNTINGQSVVVKPNRTNFGKGITILEDCTDFDRYRSALEYAAGYDEMIVVEEFRPGNEYRILVIADEVVGVLRRIAANVTGDGIHTIEQLIDLKNQDSKRGIGYKSPLEKIKKGYEEERFLDLDNKNFKTIPADKEVVYLRKNSNISTGGDSIDVTEKVSIAFKKLAIAAANSVGAKICGVDMIIKDLEKDATNDNYSIIELNFNPAIHIHDFPYQGTNRKAECKILDLLGFT